MMRVLLHICCGVCAGSVAERLLSEGHQVIGYFFNPNIHPTTEYEKRLEVAKTIAGSVGFPLFEGEYKPEDWVKSTIGLEKEPEGGKRCEVCYRLRLEAAYHHMQEYTCAVFTTTLTVSPNKPASVINWIGTEIGADKFLARDFKKKDGFKRANEIAKKLDVYRQHYCGCIYSLDKSAQKD